MSTGPGGGLSTGLGVRSLRGLEVGSLRGRPRSHIGVTSHPQRCLSSTWPNMGCCTLSSTWRRAVTLRPASI